MVHPQWQSNSRKIIHCRYAQKLIAQVVDSVKLVTVTVICSSGGIHGPPLVEGGLRSGVYSICNLALLLVGMRLKVIPKV